MVKAFVIAFLIVASVIVARPAAGSPPSDPDDDDYFTNRDIAQLQYYDDVLGQGIDVINELKPPTPECLRVCDETANALQLFCNVLGTMRSRAGCLAGVAGAAAVCRYVCTL